MIKEKIKNLKILFFCFLLKILYNDLFLYNENCVLMNSKYREKKIIKINQIFLFIRKIYLL